MPHKNAIEKKAYMRAYDRKRIPRDPEYQAAWRLKHRRRLNREAIERKYGLPKGFIDKTIDYQGGLCALCTKPMPLDHTCVDHDHGTLIFRGLVCRACNSGIGFLRDDLLVFDAAKRYVVPGDYT